MADVVVAGGNGSLGTVLVSALLEAGHDVLVLLEPGSRPNTFIAGAEVRTEVMDIRDKPALLRVLRDVDVAYNVAGVAQLDNRLHARMVAVNVQGARIFAEACTEAHVGRLVHVSSISAIGYPAPGHVADEAFNFADSTVTNSYAVTKRGGEEAVLALVERAGLNATIVCPAAVVAPWSDLKNGWAALVMMASKGKLRVAPPGRVALCSTEAFVTGALGAMQKGTPGNRYILCTQDLTYLDFFNVLNDVVGSSPARAVVPEWALRGSSKLWSLATAGLHPASLLAAENVDLMTAELRYDATRAVEELAMRPGSVRESVADVHQWLQREEHS